MLYESDDIIEDVQDYAQICENGHIINDSVNKNPQNNAKYCKMCGAIVIERCEACNAPIKGQYYKQGKLGYENIETIQLPKFCDECGEPYPWTKAEIEAMEELVALSELDEEEKKEFCRAIKDVISENPKTRTAAIKIKKYVDKVGGIVKEEMVKILTTIMVELAKNAFFGA